MKTTSAAPGSAEPQPLRARFGEDGLDLPDDAPAVHRQLAARGSIRSFRDETVSDDLLRRLCALAFCAPTKSDLQQCDIVIVDDAAVRARIGAMLAEGENGQKWLANLPCLLVFCGDNRRQRRLHELREKPFANDHLDAFFNASVDAAIVLSTFVVAAEAMGLGACPISAVRNFPAAISAMLGLPERVFPVAGLALGHPAATAKPSMRLPLSVTVHRDRYSDEGLDAAIDDYDRRRAERQPYAAQRATGRFGRAECYTWSEDKARQYARPEREDFGAYVKRIGFRLI